MTVPLPEHDTILMREHLFRRTKNLDVVLSGDSGAFKPIKERGLGLFNYKLVDMDSISEQGHIVEGRLEKVVGKVLSFLSGSTVVFLFALSLLSLAVFVLYVTCTQVKTMVARSRKKEKVDDIETLDPDLPSAFSTPAAASSHTFQDSLPATPHSPLDFTSFTTLPDPIDTKMLVSRLRIHD